MEDELTGSCQIALPKLQFRKFIVGMEIIAVKVLREGARSHCLFTFLRALYT